jgi:2'-5' RNA ligase
VLVTYLNQSSPCGLRYSKHLSRNAERNHKTRLPDDEETSGRLRLFVGITIDDQVRQKIAAAQERLKERLGPIRWVSTENLHLTLKFLGAVEEVQVAQLTDSLASALSGHERIHLSVTGLGVFPTVRRARILWAGLEGQGLEPLAESIEKGLELIGFARESRPFQPHLTIGRWRVPAKDPLHIVAALECWKDHCFGDFSVDDVNLFQSVLRSTGAVYSVLQSFHLTGDSPFATNPQEQK